MADTKTLFTQRFDAARASWTAGDERAAAESLRAAISAARSDFSLQRELASALFNLGKLSRKLGPAGEAEAASALTEALAISEALYGKKDAALAPVLHELSRLHLQQSRHASAQNALERLLAIARLKGDDHVDVAAALFDLAFVKRKLGDDASAETLYRGALGIRENALGPSHAVTVSTLERLSETCAARGNFAEALALLQRALTTREAALGADHERVRAARARVAELESHLAIVASGAASGAPTNGKAIPASLSRMQESSVDTPSGQASSPISSKELSFIGGAELPATRPAARSREFAKTPTVAAAVAASLMVSAMPAASASPMILAAPDSARSSESVTGHDSRAAHREVVFAEIARADVATVDAVRSDAAVDDFGSVAASAQTNPRSPAKKKAVMYAAIGVSAFGIAMAALLMSRPRAAGGKEPVSTAMSSAPGTTVGASVAPTSAKSALAVGSVATAMVASKNADSLRVPSAAGHSGAAIQQEQQHEPEGAPSFRAPRVNVHLDSVNLPTMPVVPNGDAILRSAIERQRASDTDRTEPKDVVAHATPADVASAHTSPKIVGRVPEPAFPPELLRAGIREGQVLVRFMVNELGRVDATSVIVERSDDELFTAAVRDILPSFRFEPARSLGRDSQPVAVWVSVPFRFTTKKK